MQSGRPQRTLLVVDARCMHSALVASSARKRNRQSCSVVVSLRSSFSMLSLSSIGEITKGRSGRAGRKRFLKGADMLACIRGLDAGGFVDRPLWPRRVTGALRHRGSRARGGAFVALPRDRPARAPSESKYNKTAGWTMGKTMGIQGGLKYYLLFEGLQYPIILPIVQLAFSLYFARSGPHPVSPPGERVEARERERERHRDATTTLTIT